MFINELWLVWQDPKTRLRHVVGKLWFKKGNYFYAYNSDNIKSAIKSGFTAHPSFPDIKTVYKSNIFFPVFKLRLPNKNRPDYLEILKKYGLNEMSTDLEILSRTGGKLATDNYEFVVPLYGCDNFALNYEFFLAGWRHWDGKKLSRYDLQPGTLLNIVPEEDNKYDKFALQVYTSDKIKIGYVPVFYSKNIYNYLAKGCNCELSVLSFNPDEDPTIVLKLKLICDGKCKR